MKEDFYRQFTLKMSPFPFFFMAKAFTQDIKSIINTSQRMVFYVFKNGTCDGYFDKSDFLQVGNKFCEKIKSDPNFIKKIESSFEKEITTLSSIAEKAHAVSNHTSDKVLNNLFHAYAKQYTASYVPASVPFLADFSLEIECGNILTQKAKARKQEYLSIFSYPSGLTWSAKEALELLAMRRGHYTDDEIKSHAQKWAWLEYDFEGAALDLYHFKNRINTLDEDKISIISKHLEESKRLKEKAIKELNLSEEEQRLLTALGELAYFKEYRKGLFSKTHHLVENLLREIANRAGLSLAQARFLLPDEMEDILLKKRQMKDELNERMRCSLIVHTGSSQKILLGDDVKKFLEEHYPATLDKNATEIRGTVANIGYAKGIVKVVMTVEDLGKMNKGDILVSAMTNPDLMPAIGKAAAIVTDTGGLTCHASIVSRELNLPCIIGTNHATELLKDGDTVEVDAQNGVVRKLYKTS